MLALLERAGSDSRAARDTRSAVNTYVADARMQILASARRNKLSEISMRKLL
jgi:hypothetical protein